MMKKIICIFIIVALLLLSGCNTFDKQSYYGSYTFDETIYLSPYSSATIDYENERMKGTKYSIDADLFKIESAGQTIEISSPIYIKESVPMDSTPLYDTQTLPRKEIEYQVTIQNDDQSKMHFRLYVSAEDVWIAYYLENTADGSEIIASIYKLSK